VTIRAGDPKPQPNTAKYALHRRRIHIFVVTTYLLYTIYEADWDIRQSSDYYQDLGISITASDRDIRSRFRRLAAMHHPDKVNSSNPSAEGYFVYLKLAQDTLLNPAKRFAYERFGPGINEWQRCSSMRDYILQGLQSILPYYGVAAVFMYLLGLLGYLEWGKYWRWLILFSLCIFELTVISRPYFPTVATKVINPLLATFTSHPPYLPFQLITLARKLSITLYIAFSQIGPLLQPPTASANSPEAAVNAQLLRLEGTARAADIEATRLLGMDMSPFAGDPGAIKDVKGKVKEWLVQNTIRNDPEVRDTLGNLLKKRRVDAPAGARGNR
jgi:DnaJ domain